MTNPPGASNTTHLRDCVVTTHPGGLINDHQAGRALRLLLRHLGVLTLGRLILLVRVSLTGVLCALSCSSQGGVALASLTQKRLNVEGVLGNLVSNESQGGGQAGSNVRYPPRSAEYP